MHLSIIYPTLKSSQIRKNMERLLRPFSPFDGVETHLNSPSSHRHNTVRFEEPVSIKTVLTSHVVAPTPSLILRKTNIDNKVDSRKLLTASQDEFEAETEIQTILLQTLQSNMETDFDNSYTDFAIDFGKVRFNLTSPAPEMNYPVYSPPTRAKNPMVDNNTFLFNRPEDYVPEGAEIGLLSISPPLKSTFNMKRHRYRSQSAPEKCKDLIVGEA